MKLGELIEILEIDDQALPVKYSDGSGRGYCYLVRIPLDGHGLLKDYQVERLEISPHGVNIVAKAAERSA